MTIHCEHCDEYYKIPFSRIKPFQSLMLMFSICPHCGKPYNDATIYAPYPRCEVCNVPCKKRLCVAHEMQRIRCLQKQIEKAQQDEDGSV